MCSILKRLERFFKRSSMIRGLRDQRGPRLAEAGAPSAAAERRSRFLFSEALLAEGSTTF